MSIYAKINNLNIVEQVIIANSKEWCENNLGGKWVRTFKNKDNKNYAGKGFIYYPDKDNFSPPKPYESWILNEKLNWDPPIPYPDTDKFYIWDENKKNWILEEIQEN